MPIDEGYRAKLADPIWRREAQNTFEGEGALLLRAFVDPEGLSRIVIEARSLEDKAPHLAPSVYNIKVDGGDRAYPDDHIRNRLQRSTKGCVAYRYIPASSGLIGIYRDNVFVSAVAEITGVEQLFEYADDLSKININYYNEGDALHWHFDNADFAITILLQDSVVGGEYQQYKDASGVAFDDLERHMDENAPTTMGIAAGDLLIFRGNRSLHRVTEVREGKRILVTLNYNEQPGVSLSRESQLTFFGEASA